MKIDDIIPLPLIYIKFTHSKKKYCNWLNQNIDEIVFDENGAKVTLVKRSDDSYCNYVWMNSCLNHSDEEDVGLLVHEASHITDDYFFYTLQESNPSSEVKAYVLQNITQYLVEKHFEWKKKNR